MSEQFRPQAPKRRDIRRQLTVDLHGEKNEALYDWIHAGAALLHISKGEFMRQALEYARSSTEEPE